MADRLRAKLSLRQTGGIMKDKDSFSALITLELRNLQIFMRSEVFVVHLAEIVLSVFVVGLAILLIPLLQWLFG
jgi:hypothetical protein